jgi:molybdopterin-containing oxidoreductase family membrane subunit
MSSPRAEAASAGPFAHLLRWDSRLLGVAAILGLVILAAAYAYSLQLRAGLGITGLNRPAYWGLYIVNFVFFIGLSAGGIIIASLVHAFGLEELRSVARIAELMAISCLLLAMSFIILDLGRPDRLLYVLWYPHLPSPLLWDVTVVNGYLLIGLVYGYFGTRADLVRAMVAKPRQRWLYRLLALGYTDLSPRARARDHTILRICAMVGLFGAVALHTVTAWILGLTKARPGWFGAIMAPLFIVSATVSGLALLLVSVILARRLLRLAIAGDVVRRLALLLAFSIPVLGYLLFSELVTVFYSAEPAALHVFRTMMYGPYGAVFWGNLVLGLLFPLALLAMVLWNVRRRRVASVGLALAPASAAALWLLGFRAPCALIPGVPIPAWAVYTIGWLLALGLLLVCLDRRLGEETRIGIAACLVVAGVLAERWNIVVPSLVGHSFLLVPPGHYAPTGLELLLVGGVYALGGLFFVTCATVLPLVESEEEA